MKTLILETPGTITLKETARPESFGEGEALVRVRRVGVCGTDLHAYRGRQPFFSYPRIMGHELGVEVLDIGPNDRGVERGAKCAVEPYINCGVCGACRRGKTNCCESLKVLGVHVDGGMREAVVVPASKLHPSDSLSFDQLALVEPLGIGAHAVERAGLEEGESVLVIGAGPIGLAVTQFAVLAGTRVTVLDVNSDRLEFCARTYPIHSAIPVTGDSAEQVRAANGGDLPTAVLDATGNADSMARAFKYCAHGGRVIYVGLVLADITFHDPDFHRKEMTLLATRNSTGSDFQRIITLMESGRIDTGSWITHRALADDVPSTFSEWLDPSNRVIKAVIEF